MSRALDPGAAASVMASNSQAAYVDIAQALDSHTSGLLDIELLGKSHPLAPGCNVLVDGNSIAVPKLKLVQAFVLARQIFFKCLENFKEDKMQDIRNSTSIILLLDPEHLTAANARKRIIEKFRAGPRQELESALNRELQVVDSYLTSRLHRHTKSPTLWSHRRWLLQVSRSMLLPRDIHQDLTAVVLVAAERHPRNYYAWLHMRWLLQSLNEKDDGVGPSGPSEMRSITRDWCLRHPADTSGWSFLLSCLVTEPSKPSRIETGSSICGEVLGLAKSFQWTHESVWVFLRTLVGTGDIREEQRALFFSVIEATIAAQPENSEVQLTLRAARDWCCSYSI